MSSTQSLQQAIQPSTKGSTHHRDSETTQVTTETFFLSSSNHLSAWLIYETCPSWVYALPSCDVTFTCIFTSADNLINHQSLHQDYTQADC